MCVIGHDRQASLIDQYCLIGDHIDPVATVWTRVLHPLSPHFRASVGCGWVGSPLACPGAHIYIRDPKAICVIGLQFIAGLFGIERFSMFV